MNAERTVGFAAPLTASTLVVTITVPADTREEGSIVIHSHVDVSLSFFLLQHSPWL